MKQGDKLVCFKTINNYFGMPLFQKGKTYEILYLIGETVVLDHILYGNEYHVNDIEFVNKHFKSLKGIRKDKINKINEK